MANGLDDVIAADTVLSHSDAVKARLWVRGLDDWLAGAATRSPSEAMRLCLAALPDDASVAEIAATVAVGVAAILRHRSGLSLVAPEPGLATTADILRMVRGAPAPAAVVQALDSYFTVAVENGLGTSTFTARTIASTRASLSSAILGAYCAFTGPLHGGAPGPVLDMLDEAQASGDVDGWLEHKLAAGGRLVGFGNRAFPNGDPRADLLAQALRALGADNARSRFAIDFEARALAALARHKPGRDLRPNLELNAALLLDACGIPRDAFTPMFAAARVAGWLAHALEQQQTGRMIRPKSRYVGAPVA
jgi:citrate synthase